MRLRRSTHRSVKGRAIRQVSVAVWAFALLPGLLVLTTVGAGADPLAANALAAPMDEPESGEPNLDVVYARINESVPTFAGLYLDTDEIVHVVLTKVDAEAGRQAAVLLKQRAHPDIDITQRRIEIAKYTYSQLKAWKDRLTDLHLTVPTWVSMGVDHERNQIDIGVTQASEHRDDVLRELDRQSIPHDAVRVYERAPAQFATSLRAATGPSGAGSRSKRLPRRLSNGSNAQRGSSRSTTASLGS